MNLEAGLLVERHTAEWFMAQKIAGAEVHDDPDVAWVVHPGSAWSNAGIMLRFGAASAEARLDALLARYRVNGQVGDCLRLDRNHEDSKD